MPLDSTVLDRIFSGRIIASAQVVAEWDASIWNTAHQRRLEEALDERLQVLHPVREGDLLMSPGGLVFTSDEGHAQLTHTALSLQREFSGAHTHDWDLVARFIAQTWLPLLEVPGSLEVPIGDLGLVITLRMSTEGYEEVNPHGFVAGLVRPPWPGGLIDAEVRMVLERDSRYLLNVGISSYQKVEVDHLYPTKLEEQRSIRYLIRDRGIQVRLDVNTRYPLLFQGKPRSVAPTELGRLVELAGGALEKDLRAIMEVARG